MIGSVRQLLRGSFVFAKQAAQATGQRGFSAGIRESLRLGYTGAWRAYGMVTSYGDPIYEEDWDLLVVLDACRADLMAEVADEYEFTSTQTATSVASCSPEWMDKNFTAQYASEISETAYVTGNRYADTHLNPENFAFVDKVYEYAWDDRGTVPPEVVTDRTIAAARECDADRIIAHYMQPHHPFLPEPLAAGMDEEMAHRDEFGDFNDVWTKLRWGELTVDEVWAAYKDTLRIALDSVSTLVENVDGKVVLTADHGNAIGEHHMYGHPIYAPVDALREVPWCEYTATDAQTYEPREDLTAKATDPSAVDTPSREEQLQALGYKT